MKIYVYRIKMEIEIYDFGKNIYTKFYFINFFRLSKK